MSDALNRLPWQPWQLNDLSPAPARPAASVPAAYEVPNEGHDEQRRLAELAAQRQQAQQEGHQLGFQQGKQQGYDAGFQAGYQAGQQQGLEAAQRQQQPITAQWQGLVSEFQQTLDALDSVIASRLMQLALTAARQIIGHTPQCDGAVLLEQIQQLIQQEPMFSGKPQLRVNPQDVERVEQQLGATLSQHGWRLVADAQIHRGGCKVSAEDGDLDASLATRWQELCRLAAPGAL
ncbi:flagellar assembly protein FliH [Nissabacter sp. SGAir0207]|uniref:flagellar assembly protein FliH n=1 Tax=Nissabacter sp. SGAir0207 TaxID=2126321 RepID=UPI0010CCC57F|nr:flagellar assembly protein FliH [Nissabacter sp. SGAir0207]QCR35827.1 flagellar assembly protein FliH [Nissabacter sp. SGAir0207]